MDFNITWTAGTSSKSIIIFIKCPQETITAGLPDCGPNKYGAIMNLCWVCGSWARESVVLGPSSCPVGGMIFRQEALPLQGGCYVDEVKNIGAPQNAGNCSFVTYQTMYVGPTEATVNACPYSNTQTITVNQTTRTVTTTVQGPIGAYATTSCQF